MFNNYLILNENQGCMLYLFINDLNLFNKYYKLIKNKKYNKLLKKIKSFLKDKNINYAGSKITIVIEGIITNVLEISKK